VINIYARTIVFTIRMENVNIWLKVIRCEIMICKLFGHKFRKIIIKDRKTYIGNYIETQYYFCLRCRKLYRVTEKGSGIWIKEEIKSNAMFNIIKTLLLQCDVELPDEGKKQLIKEVCKWLPYC